MLLCITLTVAFNEIKVYFFLCLLKQTTFVQVWSIKGFKVYVQL